MNRAVRVTTKDDSLLVQRKVTASLRGQRDASIVKLATAGLSASVIAKRIGCTADTVRNAIREGLVKL